MNNEHRTNVDYLLWIDGVLNFGGTFYPKLSQLGTEPSDDEPSKSIVARQKFLIHPSAAHLTLM